MTPIKSKAARHQRIVEILSKSEVHTQDELRAILLSEGYEVTQATLSRDLDEVGASKIYTEDGRSIYALIVAGDPTRTPQATLDSDAESRLARVAAEVVTGVEAAMNIVVIHTKAGAAHYLAGAVDKNALRNIVGSVAGDDTVLVVTPSIEAGIELRDYFLTLVGTRSARKRKDVSPSV